MNQINKNVAYTQAVKFIFKLYSKCVFETKLHLTTRSERSLEVPSDEYSIDKKVIKNPRQIRSDLMTIL